MGESDDAGARLARALEDAAQWRSMALQLKTLAEQQTEIISLLKEQRAPAHRAPVVVAMVSILICELFEKYKAARKHEHSWPVIEDKLNHLLRHLGGMAAVELNRQKWEDHRIVRRGEVMKSGRSRGKTPAESSLNEELAKAKTMLEWGEDNGYLPFNPLRKAKKNKTKGPRKTWLQEPQLQQFLGFQRPAARDARVVMRAFILVDFDSGARFEEIRTLRRDRLRQREHTDDVGTTMRWVVDIDETKNSKAHVIGLTQRTYDALMELDEVDGSPYFFARAATKRPWGRKTIGKWFRAACEATGIDAVVANGEIQLRIHDGRRSAATNAHNRGASLIEVQQMLNHSSPAVTAQYVQLNEANAAKMARIMEVGIERETKRKPPRRSAHVGHGGTDTAESDVRGTA